MFESSLARRDGLEDLGVGVLFGLLEAPEWHAATGYLCSCRMPLTCYGGHASKQAGKALRSQGLPHRTKLSRILTTLKQNKSMYTNTSRYIQR